MVLADLWGKRENEEVSTMEGESLIRKEEGDEHRSMSGAVLKDGADWEGEDFLQGGLVIEESEAKQITLGLFISWPHPNHLSNP